MGKMIHGKQVHDFVLLYLFIYLLKLTILRYPLYFLKLIIFQLSIILYY